MKSSLAEEKNGSARQRGNDYQTPVDSWAVIFFFIGGDIAPAENLRDNRNWGGRPNEKRSMEMVG